MLGWATALGALECVGIEGAGSFGAGLSRFLRVSGVEVVQVGRPKKRDRHRSGKSDPIDAEPAVRPVLAGTAIGGAKGAPPPQPPGQPRRQLRSALHVVAAERMSRHERTRSYVARRTSEGKSARKTMRCLKRYMARELYGVLLPTVASTAPFLAP